VAGGQGGRTGRDGRGLAARGGNGVRIVLAPVFGQEFLGGATTPAYNELPISFYTCAPHCDGPNDRLGLFEL